MITKYTAADWKRRSTSWEDKF